jgi:DNA primase large subunit
MSETREIGAIYVATSLLQLRYPFSVEARSASQRLARDVRTLIEVLEEPVNSQVIDEAEERVHAALMQSKIKIPRTNRKEAVLVYPTARLIVESIGNPSLKEYQAEAESKAINKHLSAEKDSTVLDLCRSSLRWTVEATGSPSVRAKLPEILRSFTFRIRFEDYLEVAPSFESEKWNLINRHLDRGWVPIRRSELDRLISGRVKQLILQSTMDVPNLPMRLAEAVQRIESETRTQIKERAPIEITGDVTNAFPPCISQMYQDSLQGKNLSHSARFTLASFLLKIGMTNEDVMGVFKAAPDFIQNLAEYQVRHISSKTSAKSPEKGYMPPNCRWLQGLSLCPVYLRAASDPLCTYVRNPLGFYSTRLWEISKNITDHSWYARKRKKRQRF